MSVENAIISNQTIAVSKLDFVELLTKLAKLKESGIFTEEEFQLQMMKLLA